MAIKFNEIDISGTSFPVTDLTAGRLFYRTDLSALYGYDGTQWAPITAGTLLREYKVPTGSVNGSNITYTFAESFSTGSLIVTRNGLVLKNGVDFFESSSLPGFTMTNPPLTNDTLLGFYLLTPTTLIPNRVIQIATATASQTVFTTPNYTVGIGGLEVYSGGLRQILGIDYTETSSSSITFTSGRELGELIVFVTTVVAVGSLGSTISQYASYVVGTASDTYNGSTTVVNLPFTYVQDGKTLQFFYNGQMLTPVVDYAETSTTSITLASAMVVDARIMARSLSGGSLANAVTFYREDYIVGTASGSYTGSTTVFNLTNTYTPGGTNLQVYLDGDLQTKGVGIDYLETSSSIVTFNNALVTGQKVTFTFSQSVAPAGTVSSGTANQIAYYPSTGGTVSGSSVTSVGVNGLLLPDGTATTPSVAFSGNTAVGIYRTGTSLGLTAPASGNIQTRVNNVQMLVANDTEVFIRGTNTNNSTSAGFVGEYVSSAVANVNATTSGQFGNITSISLTAGDWDVTGVFDNYASTATMTGETLVSISLFSGNTTTDHVFGDNYLAIIQPPASLDSSISIPAWRVALASTTTVYLKGLCSYTGGPPKFWSRISARRVR